MNALMRRQILAIMRLEVRKSLWGRRAWWIYLLALAPVLLTCGHWLHEASRARSNDTIAEEMTVFAGIFQFFYLRLGIFWGCVGIFSNLIRGEVLEKTLHYYLLAPVRREVVIAGKFASGLIAAIVFFGLSVGTAYLTIGAHLGQECWEFMFKGRGLDHLAQYLLVTTLAAIGYGSVFLVIGLKYRNPIIPAAIVMVWEGISGFLPSMLQKISVSFYLKTLCPVDVPVQGPISLLAVTADPVPPSSAVIGLLIVAAMLLCVAAMRARKLEVSYVD
ncbi:MAG: ABC transporter permease [Bryobacteraceae bacterium]